MPPPSSASSFRGLAGANFVSQLVSSGLPGLYKANIIGDFELSESDVAAITGLDRGERTGPDPDTFNYIPG